MTSDILLSLDLSTSCTGYALLSISNEKLLKYNIVKSGFKNPKTKGIAKYEYPIYQLLKMQNIADQIITIILECNPEIIVIEEINRSKNRLGQKVLDGLHWILLERMQPEFRAKVKYIDSDGSEGWRSARGLALQLSEKDKLYNKETKKFNKKLGKGQKKKAVITQKTLACRFVNKQFNLALDETKEVTDSDKADAIGMGWCYLKKVLI